MILIIITIFGHGLLSTAIQTNLLAQMRHEYEKHYHIINAVHKSAVEQYNNKHNELFTLQTTVIDNKGIIYEGISHTKKEKKRIILQTDLKKQGLIVATSVTSYPIVD